MTSIITLKDKNWLDKQRIAGQAVSACHSFFGSLLDSEEKINLLDIERECENIIHGRGCLPTFKGYKGFPGAVCLSVNKDVVHGIPKNYLLQEGDVVSLDLGATYEGAIADAAITKIYKNPKKNIHQKLLDATQECLLKGIEAIEIGKPIGRIGNAIFKNSKRYRFDNFHLITDYGGHGICWNRPHASPFVANKSSKNDGITVRPGLSIAIEPMMVIGGKKTKVKKDGWTVCGMGISAHFEHTIYVHTDKIEIITKCPD